jgi:hypothetical protein
MSEDFLLFHNEEVIPRTTRARVQPAPFLPEIPLVASSLCTAQNQSSSPESSVAGLSISSGATYFISAVERENLIRVSLEEKITAGGDTCQCSGLVAIPIIEFPHEVAC